MWQWKNFDNRPVFDEVMCRLTFLAHPVYGKICAFFSGTHCRLLLLFLKNLAYGPELMLLCHAATKAFYKC